MKDAVKRLLLTAIFILHLAVFAFSGSLPESEGQKNTIAPSGKIEIRFQGERLSLDVVDADLAGVLRVLAEKTGIDLALGEGISGRVSIHMTDTTVEEALKKLCRSRALVYEYLPQKKSYRIIQASAFAEKANKSGGMEAVPGPTGSLREESLPESNSIGAAQQPPQRLSQADLGPGADVSTKPRYKAGELLIKFKPGISAQQIDALHQSLGSKVIGKIERLRLQRIKLREGLNEETAIALYAGADIVEQVEKHALRYPNRVPNDPDYSRQWGLAKIAAPLAWDIIQGGPETVIAVIDTGVDYLHPDLKNNIWINTIELKGDFGVDDDGNGYVDDIRGWDFAGNNTGGSDSDPMDVDGHGTHVAGIIAATGNNGLGIAGINWQTRIMPLKVQADGAAYFEDFAIIEAIQYAIDNGAKIVNCSFGGKESSANEENAFIDFKNAGVLAVCAAGNDGLNTDISENVIYPAGYNLDNIISVAASNSYDNLAYFSNYGLTSVDVMAPGVDIYSSLPADTNTDAFVRVENTTPAVEYPAIGMLFAGTTNESGITAIAYDCGKGYPGEFPAEVYKNIALIERGILLFSKKVANAQTAGADGVIIYNNVEDDYSFDINGGTLGTTGEWIPAVSITKANGEALRALGTPLVNLINKPIISPYGAKSGTSMAAPHVAGIAGLIQAQCPALGYSEIKTAILDTVDKISSAEGKIASGGRVNAIAALGGLPISGDLSRDCHVGLDDAILALQILTGSTPSLPYPCLWCGKDVNADRRVGSEEAAFVLQKMAGMRE